MTKHAALFSLLLSACSQTTVVGGPGVDGGFFDGAMDGGRSDARPVQDMDGGGGPSGDGVCAAALADVPLGLVAVRFEDGAFWGLGAGGAQRLVHRPFADGGVQGEVVQRGVVLAADRLAGVVVAERDCRAGPCGRRAELFAVTSEGVATFDVSAPTDARDPGLSFVTEDGLALITMPRSASFADTRSEAIDVRTGSRAVLPTRVSSLERGPAGAEGWRLARIGETSAPGFVHLERGDVAVLEGASPRPTPFRGRWVWLTGEGVHLASRTGRTTIPLPTRLGATRLGNVFFGAPEVWRDQAIVGVVDLVRERAHVLMEPLEPAADRGLESVVEGDMVLLSSGGLPRVLFDLATGDVTSVADRVPDSHVELSAHYCTPPARPSPDGLLVALASDGHTGAFRIGEGAPEPLGRPVRDVSWASLLQAGPTVVIVGNTGRMTFCPQVEPTDDPPEGDELVGDSVQLVLANGSVRTLEPESSLAYLDPGGRCALQVPQRWPGPYALLDLVTGEELSWEGEGGWWPLVSAPFPRFF